MPQDKKQDRLKVGVGYIRESTEDQDKGFSPDNQRRQIEEYAKRNHITIAEWYKDLVSGTSAAKRDDFQRMISDAMQHKFEAILIYHTSRFARNVQESRQYKDLLRKKLGIDVVSITQHFGDWKDPSAFLNEGVNELFDEHTSRQISFWVRTSLMEKRMQGYQRGNPPFGYHKKKIGFDKEKNRPIYEREWLAHPKESKLVVNMFKLYATGKYSFLNIAEEMQKEGVLSKYNNPFTFSSVKDMLKNKAYLGLVTSPGKNLPDTPGKHPAIVSKDLFEKVQTMIKKRFHSIGRPIAQHRFYLLQGLLYCYACIKHLKGKENKPGPTPLIPRMYCKTTPWNNKTDGRKESYYYACKIKRETKTCSQPDVECGVLDKQVLDFMESIKLPDDIIRLTLEKLGVMFDNAKAAPKEEDKARQLESKKKKLNFMFSNTDELTGEEYLKQLKEIEDQLAFYRNLGLTDTAKGMGKREALKRTETFLRDFRKFWKSDIGSEERRSWIQMTIKRIWVKDRKIFGIEPREDFKPLFSFLKKASGQAPIATQSGNNDKI